MVGLGKKIHFVRKYLFIASLFILCQSVFAQNDSLVIAGAPWKKNKLQRGVVWKRHHFNQNQLFSTNQYLSVLEISKTARKSKLALGYSDSLENTSTICKRYGAIAGINGSYFKMKGSDPDHQPIKKSTVTSVPKHVGNRSIVYLRVADSLISENTFARDSLRRRHQQGVMVITGGQLSIYNPDASSLYWEHSIPAEDILATGPVMLIDGKKLLIPDDAFCRDRHPRTAVGKRSDGTIVLFTVDGRTSQSAGMSITELQQVMLWLGCKEAINLDGGGSTSMFIGGQPDNGVVNHPSDNKRFDHTGERQVANVLMLLPKRTNLKIQYDFNSN